MTHRDTILATARRRTISADVEARALGITTKEAQAIIAGLRRDRLIYQSSRAVKNFFGSGFAGYRAV